MSDSDPEPVVIAGSQHFIDGRYEEARGCFARAVAAAEKGDVPGRIDHEILGSNLLHAVGSCYARTGRFDEARGWYERAVAAKEKGDVHGRIDHESLEITLRALATLDDDVPQDSSGPDFSG